MGWSDNRYILHIGVLFIFFLAVSPAAFSQGSPISGQVMDISTGETLPGVNILVKGTTTGTSTDDQGNFVLDVSSLQDTLVVSFIGYQTKEVPINVRTAINIQLTPEAIIGEQ